MDHKAVPELAGVHEPLGGIGGGEGENAMINAPLTEIPLLFRMAAMQWERTVEFSGCGSGPGQLTHTTIQDDVLL